MAQGEPRAVVPFWCETHLSHAASEGSRVDLPSIWHRLVKARLRLSERRAKRVWAMPSVSSLDEVKAAIKRAQSQTCLGYAEREQSRRSQQKQQKQQAKKRQAPCLIYIYILINNYTYSTIIYINAPLLFSKTGVAFVAFVACVAASKQSATKATKATSENERLSLFLIYNITKNTFINNYYI